jgi:hypothetical protein
MREPEARGFVPTADPASAPQVFGDGRITGGNCEAHLDCSSMYEPLRVVHSRPAVCCAVRHTKGAVDELA